MAEILLILLTSRYHIYTTVLIAKPEWFSQSVQKSDENLIVFGDQES